MYRITDEKVQKIIDMEYERQSNELEMIASENYVSKDVLMACANVFTNKYSEWYPHKRYYWGQQNVDKIELLTQYRALQIFWLNAEKVDESNFDNNEQFFQSIENVINQSQWNVNVQPLSWSPANLAVYLGILKPWDTILWMDLAAGWHLSHWHPLNSSWIYYKIVAYWVKTDTFLIDYDDMLNKALEHKPTLILAGYSAYPRDIEWNKYKQVADEVEKVHWYRPFLMADIAHIAWLIAGGALCSPFDHFDIVTTTTHKTLRWPRWALIYYRNQKYTILGKEQSMGAAINRWVFPWIQWWPHEHIIAAKCVAFGEILSIEYKDYIKKVISNAKLLAEKLMEDWWRVITEGTDNHIVLLDVTKQNWNKTNLTGKIAEKTLESIGISVNKNMLPFDERSPMDPSWLRLGTPAITTRWLGEKEIIEIVNNITFALDNFENEEILSQCKAHIKAICQRFPLPY